MSRKVFSTFLQILILSIFVTQLFISSIMSSGLGVGYVPDDEKIEYRPLDATYDPDGGSRRVLEPFQLCLHCRCCAANDPGNCSSMPCCFGISCNLPDKPYGVCAFVPKICNCTSCA